MKTILETYPDDMRKEVIIVSVPLKEELENFSYNKEKFKEDYKYLYESLNIKLSID